MSITVQEIKDMAMEQTKGVTPTSTGSRVSQFRQLRTNQKTAEQFYKLNFDFKVHKKFEKIKLPTARKMVETYMSHLPLNNPVIEVIPFKLTNPYKNRAIKQQDFGDALLRLAMQQTDDPIFNGAKDIGVRGELFFKLVEDVTAWEAGLEKRKGESDAEYQERMLMWKTERMPIKILCPDPMTCYPSQDHTDCRPDNMLQIYTLQAGQVRAMFPKWKSRKLDTTLIKVVEFWSPKEYCVLGDNTEATDGVQENKYGFTPYVHVYSGWGMRDDNNSPESKAVSLLFGAYHLLLTQCRWHSYLDKAISFASMPTVHAEGEREDYIVAGRELEPEPGMVTYGAEGKKVTINWAAPNLPAGIMAAIGIADTMLERGGQPAVLKGVPPKGVEAGYPMALMIGEARLEFGTALENLQMAVARTLEMARLLIRDVIKDEVPIWGENKLISLSPTDCEGAYRYVCKFDSSTPEGRANRALAGQRLRQGNSISRRTELEVWQNNKNPQGEINRMSAEDIFEHPAIKRYIATRAVQKKWGLEAAREVYASMAEGEAGAVRKARSTGVPEGGKEEARLPEDILAQVLSQRRSPTQESTEELG